ncbi:MAG: SAM-dependent chlorinase/fluorinase [Candidatus Korarchaeota archaeon]|nr:SAM-dependent chlorinase/fluorinase [Candidatus Korarchaeota archaeon]
MTSIYLITDFGTEDYYVGAMKGVIRTQCPKVDLVDISHGVKKFNIKHGAFILWQAYRWIERGSIVLGVVDPGVGTARDPIIVKAGPLTFVGPDNGLFWPVVQEMGEYEIFKIDMRGTGLAERRTGTFDGRDVFAPVSAMLACGKSPDDLGFRKKSMEVLDLWKMEEGNGYLKGEVLNVDSFGNVVTNVRWGKVGAEKIEVITPHSWAKAVRSTHYGGKGLLMIRGSTDLLELSLAGGSAADFLGVDVGDSIELRWR